MLLYAPCHFIPASQLPPNLQLVPHEQLPFSTPHLVNIKRASIKKKWYFYLHDCVTYVSYTVTRRRTANTLAHKRIFLGTKSRAHTHEHVHMSVHAYVHVFTYMCTHTPALTCALRHTYTTSDCKLRHSKYFHIRGNIIEYVSLNVGSLAIYLVQLLTSRYHQVSYRFEIINCQFCSFLVIYI